MADESFRKSRSLLMNGCGRTLRKNGLISDEIIRYSHGRENVETAVDLRKIPKGQGRDKQMGERSWLFGKESSLPHGVPPKYPLGWKCAFSRRVCAC